METVAPTWRELCEASARRFGSPAAAVYPFIRLNPYSPAAPLVRTHLGEARVLSVVVDHEGFERVEIVLQKEYRARQLDGTNNPKPRLRRLAPSQILPPIGPPPTWQR